MPYRRLPNTDNARLRALKKATSQGELIPPFKLAFSQATLQKVRHFVRDFEHAMIVQKEANGVQVTSSKEYLKLQKKAKLYISHFIQVLNFAILRGELPSSAKKFYGLKENETKLPSLNTDKEIILWGERIIKGEADRLVNGGNYITNPTIAVVRVRFETFVNAYRSQKLRQETTNRALTKIGGLRAEADSIILSVWNEVEATFGELSDVEKREKSSEYGLVYVFRKSELGIKSGYNLEEEADDEANNEDAFDDLDLAQQRIQIMNNNIETEESEEKDTKEQLQYALMF